MDVSIVIPVYNGEAHLREIAENIGEELDRCRLSWEIILIDDHSSDKSYTVIADLHRNDRRYRGGRLAANRGQQNALYAGLTLSCGDRVITMDDDGQHPREELLRLWEKIGEGYDVVYMVRNSDERSLIYRAGTGLTDLFFRLFCGKPARLRIGSFRIMTRDVVNRIVNETTDFVYLSALIFRRVPRARITALTYRERPSERGKGRIGFLRRIIIFKKLIAFYGPLSEKRRPVGTPFIWEEVL